MISYHITDNPHFELDPNHHPEENYLLNSDTPNPGTYVTGDVEPWFNGYDYVRPYVAEIEHPEIQDRYHGMNQRFLPASMYPQSTVKRLMPIDEFAKEKWRGKGWLEEHFEPDDWQKGQNTHLPEGYRYQGPDVREMTPEEHAWHAQRVKQYIEEARPHMTDENGEWHIEAATNDLLQGLLAAPGVPAPTQKVGATQVSWWEGKPGDAVVIASGGSADDRWLGEQVVTAELERIGYKRASFTVEAGWPDIEQKAKRLVQSGNVTMLRNGYNNIVAHVVGDHGEYTCEIGRDDPESRSITTWQCECPWDQYAWQRTRKWKKYEGRPCAHVLAAFWKSQATPLDEAPPGGQQPTPGQALKAPPEPPPSSGGGGNAPPGGNPVTTPMPEQAPAGGQTSFGPEEAMGMSAPMGMGPPGESGILPPSPMDQLSQMQPPVPGATPGGMPANPAVVSVPGAKMPTPFNPIQYPGGTYSKTAAEEFAAPAIVRLKVEGYGMAEGKSEAHGAGQYQSIPAGSTGEVLYQDPSTGWVEVIFPLHESSYMEPYHVKMFCDPNDIELTNTPPPGPFIKRR